MFKSGNVFLTLLLVLAGCSTASKRTSETNPDWEPVPTQTPVAASTPTAPPPPPTAFRFSEPRRSDSWVSLEQWGRLNGLSVTPQSRVPGVPAASALNTPKGVLTVKPATRLASWDGMQLQLGFAPRETNDVLMVHALDVRKNIQPLLENPPAPRANPVIVIDPGHGGGNTGARSVLDGRHEKEFTLDWALRLQSLLAAVGWKAFLTRTNDLEVPLGDRVAFAEKHHADLFISLHFNSSPSLSPEQSGLETYCLTPAGMPSNLTREFDDNIALTYPNNAFDALNLSYAVRLHRALLQVNGNTDRGIRRARFMGVLRGQNRPAVLLEGGYLTNPHEAQLIADPEYRQKLAAAVAGALTGSAVATVQPLPAKSPVKTRTIAAEIGKPVHLQTMYEE